MTRFCTCGLNCGSVFNSVTESVYYFLCYKNCITNGAVLTLCKTCFCASRSNCLVNFFFVTKSRNYNSFTVSTYLRFGTSCLGTEIIVRTFNVNGNFSTLEGNCNFTTICRHGISFISAGISSTPVVVTSNLKHVITFLNVLIYLSIYAVSIGHIVCCVACIPLSTKMSAATCNCEGSLCITSCAKVAGVESMSKSGNYGILTIKTHLRGSTCCSRTEIGMSAGGTECTPGSAALIPRACLNGIMVSTTGRNNKVSCLVPFVVPVVSRSTGVHSTEDYVGVSCGNFNLIYAVFVGVCHANPLFAVSEEISSETSVRLLPVRVGCEIECLWGGSSTCCKRCHARQEYYYCKKSD